MFYLTLSDRILPYLVISCKQTIVYFKNLNRNNNEHKLTYYQQIVYKLTTVKKCCRIQHSAKNTAQPEVLP